MPDYTITNATNKVVTLEELLLSKEQRYKRQILWRERYQATLLSFTVVMPGTVKDSLLSRRIFQRGWQALLHLCQQKQWSPLANACFWLPTGAEGLIALAQDAVVVKEAVMLLEQHYDLGRLWDFDVIDLQGNVITRQRLNLPSRRCLICECDARVCARAQTHSLHDLLMVMEKRLNDH